MLVVSPFKAIPEGMSGYLSRTGEELWMFTIFVITFFAISGFFWYFSLSLLYGPADSTASTLGEAFGEAIGKAIIASIGLIVAVVTTVIFLIFLIIYLVKKAKK